MISTSRLLTRSRFLARLVNVNKPQQVSFIHIDFRHQKSQPSDRSRVLLRHKNAPLFISGNLSRFASTGIVDGVSIVSGNEEPIQSSTTDTQSITSSTEVSSTTLNPLKEDIVLKDPIPEPPTPLLEVAPPVEQLVGDASFESLGLGGWTPVGLIENAFEFLHFTCDLPWWTSIIIGTIVVRTLMFPLVIIAQRNAAKMNNNLPQIQVLQLKMTEARERGDRLEAARYAQEMMTFMSEKKLNPLKNMLVPLAQAPLFISFFMSLREMSNLPVESLKYGGLFWFTDLTVPDQFYLLPLITSATLALTIELGTDAGRIQSANLGMMKYVLRCLPIVIFPFTINFSNAILVYWVSTNFISLCQVLFLKIPKVRAYFQIEQLVHHTKDTLPIKDKGFVKGMSESWTNMKLTRELEERQRVDEINFMRAGRGAVKKTFKFDPTQLPRTIKIQAKKSDN